MPRKVKVRLIKGSLPKNKLWVPKDNYSTDKDSDSKISQNEVIVSVAEWETLRLCDLEKYKQRDVAQIMHLSQPTVNRLLAKAHSKIVQALFNGYVLKFENELIDCPKCHEHLSSSTEGDIICPNCNHTIKIN